MPVMNFDALPYVMFRRVLGCLEPSEKMEASCIDVKRAVLSFCVWERAAARKGGKAAAPYGGGSLRGKSGYDTGDLEGSGSSLGWPIYRFLSVGERKMELQKTEGLDLKTVLASYPRSGNSLLRRLLEEVSGVITGSDTRPDRTLSRSLSVFGMQGEGVVDGRVQVVKTHYPERTGYRQFEGKKAILLVRNPFDAINSYFNMTLTNTHDKSLHDFVYEEFQELWDGMIRNEMKVWGRFNLYWLSSSIPVHVLRYEDLLTRPEEVLTNLVAFIHEISQAEVENIYGDRIRGAPAVITAGQNKEACVQGEAGRTGAATINSRANGRTAAGPYRPRAAGGVGGSFRRRFNHEQVAWCVREAGTLLRQFGYDPESQSFPLALIADSLKLDRLQTHYNSSEEAFVAGGEGTSIGDSVEVPVRSETVKTATCTIRVNEKTAVVMGVRGTKDTFGRNMTAFRRSHTQQDTRPLPLDGEDVKAKEWLRRRQTGKEEARAALAKSM